MTMINRLFNLVKDTTTTTTTEVVPPTTPSVPASCPFPLADSTPVVPTVRAIPLTHTCPACSSSIPTDAHYCPMCRVQLVVPMVTCRPAPVTACKVKGMPTSSTTPAKAKLLARAKGLLTSDMLVPNARIV